MSNAAAKTVQQQPAPVARGFPGLRCPKCGECGSINVMLNDVDIMTCLECEDEFYQNDVRELIEAAKSWEACLAWLNSAPVIPAA